MKENHLSEQESLEIITSMIQKARANLTSNMTSSILLLWGYTTFFVAIMILISNIYHLWHYQSLLWLAIPLICYPRTIYYSLKGNHKSPSYIDKSFNHISILYIIICSSIGVATFWSKFPVFFIEGLLISMWAVSIGILIKYRKIVLGGVAGIVLSHSFLFVDNVNLQLVFLIAIISVTITIPGHLFNNTNTR
jgi:hypothetical protein